MASLGLNDVTLESGEGSLKWFWFDDVNKKGKNATPQSSIKVDQV